MFWILALPRSRTAWLANLLTHGKSFCFHDGLRGAGTWDQYVARLKMKHAQGYQYVGDSDSGLLFFQDQLKEIRGQSPLVIIRRDPNDVRRSLSRMAIDRSHAVEQVQELMERAWTNLAPDLVLDYADLEYEDACRSIAAICTPSVPWDPDRWAMLDMLRVTIDEDKYAFAGTEASSA